MATKKPRYDGMLENDRSLRLVSAGILLFLIGLLTGLFLPVLPYPRTGLAAHMEGVLNGMFLVLLGLIWSRLTLSPATRLWPSGSSSTAPMPTGAGASSPRSSAPASSLR
jgi:hypothetical protein